MPHRRNECHNPEQSKRILWMDPCTREELSIRHVKAKGRYVHSICICKYTYKYVLMYELSLWVCVYQSMPLQFLLKIQRYIPNHVEEAAKHILYSTKLRDENIS